MIAVDTNLLVYAHRTDAPFHAAARPLVESLAQGTLAWAIPWPCAHEFAAIVTNARTLAASVHLQFLAEGDGYLPQLERLAVGAQTRGGAIHDARIAAICLHHGVTELWSADRDFSRFPALRTRNPLAG